MENKIYIVICEAGEWHDYTSWIGGVSTDKKIADEICQEINDQAKEFIDACPVKLSDNSTDEEKGIYYNYYSPEEDKSYLKEWRGATVKEYDSNCNLMK